MKKSLIMILFAAMLLVANQGNAQYGYEMMGPPPGMGPGMGPGGPRGPKMNSEQMIKGKVKRLTKHLQLTQEQATEIEALYKAQAEDQKKQREEMFKSGQRPDMEAMRAKMEKERSEMDAKIGKVLTPEQFEKYKEMKANRDKGRMAPGQRGPKKHHGKMKKGCCCDKAKSEGENKAECKGEHKGECKKESKKEDCKCKK